MRVLLAGWFSFEGMNTTAGDLLARDVAARWLEQGGYAHDVAVTPALGEGVDFHAVDPARYTHLVFVCGPFRNTSFINGLLARFAGCRRIGLNLSMLTPLDEWNPFDVLLERDSTATARPDITFASDAPPAPVIGVCLVHPQHEYGKKGLHRTANEAIQRLTESRPMAVVRIDTCLEQNKTGLRVPAEVEALLARMDVVLTTRLHGTVLSLKNGVPVVAVDPIAGGAKILRQAETIGWPVVFTADAVSDDALSDALDFCLTPAARDRAAACAARAREAVDRTRAEFLAGLAAEGR
jgi:hypothetical protein